MTSNLLNPFNLPTFGIIGVSSTPTPPPTVDLGLNQQFLSNKLFDILNNSYISASVPANKLSLAYSEYAARATCGAGLVTLTGTEHIGLYASLVSAMQVPLVGSARALASAWANGYLAFWLTPPVSIVGAQSGIVTSVSGATGLQTALTLIFSNSSNTPRQTADQMAAALNAATKLVFCTVTPPISTILPLS